MLETSYHQGRLSLGRFLLTPRGNYSQMAISVVLAPKLVIFKLPACKHYLSAKEVESLY
jgi:hypothetical protein